MPEDNKGQIVWYSDVISTPIKWLWEPYIALGKTTIIQGDPGEGKTTLALVIAACVSQNRKLPFNTDAIGGCVIYQNAEDNPADTIKPRLDALNANCNKIFFIEGDNKEISTDLDELEKAIKAENAKLVVLDPLQAYIGDSDLCRANDMRSFMGKLGIIAARNDCAIIVIGHQNKNEGGKDLYRGLGSIDITAVARSVISVKRDENDEDIRLMTHVKNSLAPNGKTIAFRIKGKYEVEFIDDYTSKVEIQSMNENKKDIATAIITEVLVEGAEPCEVIYKKCMQFDISKRTIDSAKSALGVKSVRKDNIWYWSLGE